VGGAHLLMVGKWPPIPSPNLPPSLKVGGDLNFLRRGGALE